MQPNLSKYTRFFIYFIILLMPFYYGCQGAPAGAGGGFGFGGCSATQFSSTIGGNTAVQENETPNNSPSTNLDIDSNGGPLPIPVTIAKAVDGVDATSIIFDAYNEANGETNQKFLLNNVINTPVGLLTVGTIPDSGTAIAVINGQISDIIPFTASSFQYETEVNMAISFLILEPGADVSNGPFSFPVTTTVTRDKALGGFALTVHITNTSTEVKNQAIAANIQALGLALDHNGMVAFSAVDKNAQPIIGTIDILGGANAILNPNDNLWDQLSYSDDDPEIWGIDTQSNLIKIFDGESIINVDQSLGAIPEKRSYQVHPSHQFLATQIKSFNNNIGIDSMSVGFVDTNSLNLIGALPIPSTESELVNSLSYAWLNNSELIVFKNLEQTNRVESYDVSEIISGISNPQINLNYEFELDIAIDSPLSDLGFSKMIYFRCLFQESYYNLCRYDQVENKITTVIHLGYDIVNAKMSTDYSYIIFEGQIDDQDNILGIYHINDQSIELLNRGTNATIHPSDDDLIAYLSYDKTQQVQISVMNLQHQSLTPLALIIEPQQIDLAVDYDYTFRAFGGQPPYNYQVVDGVGEINQHTGYFKASHQTGESIIEVVDSVGNTAQTIVQIRPALENVENENVKVTESKNFEPNGGAGPFEYEIVTGGGSIDQSGNYTADNNQGPVSIKVTDSFGATATINAYVEGQPGDFDSFFNQNGFNINNGTINDSIKAMSIQSDGKIVGVGTVYDVGKKQAVIRTDALGNLDVSFGTNGVFEIDVNGGTGSFANDVKIQSDDKIVVVGQYFYGQSLSGVSLTRLNANGSLDTSFGANGIVTLNIAHQSIGKAVQIQSDGKIVIAGITQQSGSNPFHYFSARFLSNGQIDTSYAINGISIVDVGGNENLVEDLLIQTDGKIIVVGSSFITGSGFYQSSMIRLTQNGIMDNSFGNVGYVFATTNGGSDTKSFAAHLQNDGKLLIAGSSSNGSDDDIIVFRFLENGSLDQSFGNLGTVITQILAGSEVATAIQTQSDDKIIIAANTNNGANTQAVTVRYNENGSVDTSYANGGIQVIGNTKNDVIVNDFMIDQDGKYLFAGHYSQPASDDNMYIRQLWD
ncbi:hypothetical protein BVY03_03905 [bacterium K02(2017)]|nr:hypothetical protein BVY03_03905 [bacterium K02(2017)]